MKNPNISTDDIIAAADAYDKACIDFDRFLYLKGEFDPAGNAAEVNTRATEVARAAAAYRAAVEAAQTNSGGASADDGAANLAYILRLAIEKESPSASTSRKLKSAKDQKLSS